MSYPEPRYHGDTGVAAATFRPAGHDPELTYPSAGAVHYLATGASTGGEFGLYRWEMAGPPSGPGPHFHKPSPSPSTSCPARSASMTGGTGSTGGPVTS